MPAPFGLIRYGVAPDHPRIKGIITALHQVLDKPQIRLFGNVDYPTEISLDHLRAFYDAVIFSTGATADRELSIPGVELDGSYGAADFVWYDGHPDVPRTWPLEAEKVAAPGVGNVALDVARILAKTADELLPTEIPLNVHEGLKANKALEVHEFGRRGPAQAKFSPLELRELDHSPNIEVIVDPEDIDYDEGSIETRRGNKQADMVAKTLEKWAIRDVGDRPHKLFLHFFESPSDSSARTARSSACAPSHCPRRHRQRQGHRRVQGLDVTAVYRAVGYLSDKLPKLPWDIDSGTVPDQGGRVVQESGEHLQSTYVTGWIRARAGGPDRAHQGRRQRDGVEPAGRLRGGRLHTPASPAPEAVDAFLTEREVRFTTWEGWYGWTPPRRRWASRRAVSA
ncbi:ferredoxin--NADP(+) reductase OS=Streptomyces alboniger OX=132473 GN=CP975_02250 PE=3 SV=1 [Streptomyces alboniger]